jgi:hypothetical protein
VSGADTNTVETYSIDKGGALMKSTMAKADARFSSIVIGI